MNRISPCLWFDHQAQQAVDFYSSVFKNTKVGRSARYNRVGAEVSGQKEGFLMTLEIQIENLDFTALNGGPTFRFSPALSFSVACESEAEINALWAKLSAGGTVRMGLDKYFWAPKYGWTTDQFGVEWQLILAPSQQKITPAFLFTTKNFGKGEEAIDFYMSVFNNSKIESISRNAESNTVLHCAFQLDGQRFVLMEGPGEHNSAFTHATSLVVTCSSQAEIDKFHSKLLAGGGSEEPCGWLRDKYGVSWQIVPDFIADVMSDPVASSSVMAELVKMKKIDIARLRAAM